MVRGWECEGVVWVEVGAGGDLGCGWGMEEWARKAARKEAKKGRWVGISVVVEEFMWCCFAQVEDGLLDLEMEMGIRKVFKLPVCVGAPPLHTLLLMSSSSLAYGVFAVFGVALYPRTSAPLIRVLPRVTKSRPTPNYPSRIETVIRVV